MRLDVTLVSPYPSRSGQAASGVAWYTQHLAHSLSESGATVTVVAPHDGGGRSADLDQSVRIERCFPQAPTGLPRAARAARATGAALTHVQHEVFLYGGPASMPGLMLALAQLRAARRGPVVTMHQVVAPATIDRAFTDMHRVKVPAVAARAGLATVQGAIAGVAQATIVHEPAFTDVVGDAVVIPLGADLVEGPAARRGAERAAALRAAHNLDRDTFVVLCFGFVAPYKGLEPILEGAEVAGPRVRVVVAGAEHPRLAGHGYLAGLTDRYHDVATFTGFVPDADVGAWFSAADVTMLAYPQAFSSSGVLALAAAHGTPMLLSPSLARCCGAPEALSVGLDPSELAARLRRLASEPTELEELGAHSRRLAQGRSWPEVATRHLRVYEEVIDAQRAARETTQHRPRQ